MKQTVAQRLALWADKLRDISAMGLLVTQSFHDRESYHKIQDIALEMLALAAGSPPAEIEPLRAPIFERPTPLVTADAAVIDAEGRILLVKQAGNDLWAMPGGALQVGETPAGGAARQVFAASGLRCEPVTLVGVYDSRLGGTVSRHHLYQFVFLCRPAGETEGGGAPAVEVKDVAWFPENGALTGLDPGQVRRILDAYRAWHGVERAYFDR